MKHRCLWLLSILTLFSGPALADSVELSMAWARATPGAAANGVAYLTVTNHGAATAIVGAETTVAARASLHTHLMDGDIMRMRPVDSVPIEGGATVMFAPGGLHVMLNGLTHPLAEGDKFALTLIFDDDAARMVDVTVAEVGAMMAPGHAMPQDSGETGEDHHGH